MALPKLPKPDTTNPFSKTPKDPDRAKADKERQKGIATIQKSLADVGKTLGKEEKARTSQIEREAQTQREKMGRTFGIDPGKLAGGRAIRVAGTIGAGEMKAKTDLASEMSQRRSKEEQQAFGLLQTADRDARMADLSEQQQNFIEYAQQRQMTNQEFNDDINRRVQAGEFTIAEKDAIIRERAQQEAETEGGFRRELSQQAQDFSEGIGLRQMDEAEATGEINRAVAEGTISRDDADQLLRERAQDEAEASRLFSQGLSQQAQDFAERIGLRQMDEAEATGEVNRAVANETISRDDADQLLRARAQTEAERTGRSQRELATRAMDDQELNSAMSRAQTQGEATGDFTDPVTGQTVETLQAELGRRAATVSERQITLAEGAQSDDVRIRDFTKDLQAEIQRGNLTEEQARTRLQGRQVSIQEQNQRHQEDMDRLSATIEGRKTDIAMLNSAYERARSQGDATGEYTDPETGDTMETLESKIRTEQNVLARNAHDLNVVREANNLTMGTFANETSRIDVSNRKIISDNELKQREDEFVRNRFDRQKEFTDTHNLSKKEYDELVRAHKAGEDIEDDKLALSIRMHDERQTHEENKYTNDLRVREAEINFQESVQEALITGEFKGNLTQAALTQKWEQGIEEARIWGDEPPRIMRANEMEGLMVEAGGSVRSGTDLYEDNKHYDLDGNGYINMEDRKQFETMGEALDDSGNTRMITREGRSTLAQKQMLINSDQFKSDLDVRLKGVTNEEERTSITKQAQTDSMTKFRADMALRKDDFNRLKEQYASSQTGVLMKVDEQGNYSPAYVYDTEEKEWVVPTTLQKEIHDQNDQRFERDFNIQATDLAERIGVIPKDPDVAIQRFWGEVFEGGDTKIGGVEMKDWLQSHMGGARPTDKNIQAVFTQYMRNTANEDGAFKNKSEAERADITEQYSARFAKQFLLGSINEESQGAISSTMAQAVFGANYQQPPPPPGVWGRVASAAGAFLGSAVSSGINKSQDNSAASDVNLKTDIFPLQIVSDIATKDDITNIATGDDVLERLDDMPVSTWRYKHEPKEVRHMGPMAQHFKEAFNLGNSDKKIDVVDGMGVALTVSKQLSSKFKNLDKRLRSIERFSLGGK